MLIIPDVKVQETSTIGINTVEVKLTYVKSRGKMVKKDTEAIGCNFKIKGASVPLKLEDDGTYSITISDEAISRVKSEGSLEVVIPGDKLQFNLKDI